MIHRDEHHAIWRRCPVKQSLTELSNQVLEPGIYAGVPAKKVKDASEAIAAAAHKNAQGYLLYKTWYE